MPDSAFLPRPRPPFPRALLALIVLFAVGLSFASGMVVGRGEAPPASARPSDVANQGASAPASLHLGKDVDFNQFWEVWGILKQRFYKPLDDKNLYDSAVKGLVAGAGDPYTLFMTPDEAKQFTDDLDGAFDGIGAEIGVKNGQLQIIAPLPDTPAMRAGLAAGDAILAIDKASTQGMSVDEAVSKIRGQAGTQVTLTVRHGKEAPKDVAITRATITVDSVTSNVDHGIATITISIFGPDTPSLFSKAVTDALAQGAKGVILDVRGNPGGLLTDAIDVASAWVGDRTVVREKGPNDDQTYDGHGPARLAGLPTVVLVDGGSASASEIVAGALQDDGFATLVGTQTFGKGSVQDLIDLSDGSAVKVTIAAWHTPKDRSINGTGITPDVVVALTDKDIHDKRDVQKEKAVAIIQAALAGKR